MEPYASQLPRYDATVEHARLLGEAIRYVGRNLTAIRAAATSDPDALPDRLDELFTGFGRGQYDAQRCTDFIRLAAQWETEHHA